MADRLGHSSVMLTLDTYSHVTPAMDHAAANLIAGLVVPIETFPLAGCLPLADSEDHPGESDIEKARSDGVGRRGIEPRTRGLKVRSCPVQDLRQRAGTGSDLRRRCSTPLVATQHFAGSCGLIADRTSRRLGVADLPVSGAPGARL